MEMSAGPGGEVAGENSVACVSPKLRALPADAVRRAAREFLAAYGPAAPSLMRRRAGAVARRGDAECAALWQAVASAIEQQLQSNSGAPRTGTQVPVRGVA